MSATPVPRQQTAIAVAIGSAIALAGAAWFASWSGAPNAQDGIVHWFNDPPQPLAVVLAAVNPLLRPIPLTIASVLLLGWVLYAAGTRVRRLEVVRATVVAILVAELFAQVLKRVVDQPRPLAVIPGLDTHGYPGTPIGAAFPSAHTAVVVALVGALWPWMRWPQRVVAVLFAVLIACHRLYIGAHWPVDVIGGAAIGLLAAAFVWLTARRWPIHDDSRTA